MPSDRIFMIKPETIEEVKNRLIKVYNPVAIYLFGSYAWGQPDEESDLDLVIIVDKADKNPYQRPLLAYDVLMDIDVRNEILVYTKEEFDYRSENIATLDYQIKRRGKLLYARA